MLNLRRSRFPFHIWGMQCYTAFIVVLFDFELYLLLERVYHHLEAQLMDSCETLQRGIPMEWQY